MIEHSDILNLARNAYWYHTIKLAVDIETNGVYDHRPYLHNYYFPSELKNWTVLDVGAANGFFSFEFERMGSKDIFAIDTNCYNGEMPISCSPRFSDKYTDKYKKNYDKNIEFKYIYEKVGLSNCNMFLFAKSILNSNVKYENKSIYDMENEKFDFVFCGDLIEHLKNPILAVEKLYNLTRKMCIISLSSIPFDIDKKNSIIKYAGNISGGSFFHFYPSTFRELLIASGFSVVEIKSTFDLPNKKRKSLNKHAIFHCYP